RGSRTLFLSVERRELTAELLTASSALHIARALRAFESRELERRSVEGRTRARRFRLGTHHFDLGNRPRPVKLLRAARLLGGLTRRNVGLVLVHARLRERRDGRFAIAHEGLVHRRQLSLSC